MDSDKKNRLLPPRPGEKSAIKDKKNKKIVLYINGETVEMSYTEALGVLAQISQILCYFDLQEKENNG